MNEETEPIILFNFSSLQAGREQTQSLGQIVWVLTSKFDFFNLVQTENLQCFVF